MKSVAREEALAAERQEFEYLRQQMQVAQAECREEIARSLILLNPWEFCWRCWWYCRSWWAWRRCVKLHEPIMNRMP